MQARVRAHERGTPTIVDRALDLRPDGGHGIVHGGDQPHLVGVAGALDARLHATPEKDPVVGRLATTARIEGRAIEHDALLGVHGDDRRGPLAQGGVLEFEPGRPHPQRPWWATAAAAVAAASGSR